MRSNTYWRKNPRSPSCLWEKHRRDTHNPNGGISTEVVLQGFSPHTEAPCQAQRARGRSSPATPSPGFPPTTPGRQRAAGPPGQRRRRPRATPALPPSPWSPPALLETEDVPSAPSPCGHPPALAPPLTSRGPRRWGPRPDQASKRGLQGHTNSPGSSFAPGESKDLCRDLHPSKQISGD